jgi:hypothetical protein
VLVETRQRARVRVTFHNGGARELRYSLVFERGRFRIDDVESIVPPRWVLSQVLARKN